jgi:hypothetical protein
MALMRRGQEGWLHSAPHMRTWVLIVLLAVMTFQSSWASAAVYCRHGGQPAAQHFGHHEHKHVSVVSVSSDGSTTPDPNFGSLDDCGLCHLSCVQPLPATPSFIEPSATVPPLVPAALRPYVSRERDRIERPNWLRLARSASLEEMRIS